MVAATITLVTLLCGTLVGFLIYRWRRGKPFSIAWALGSFLLAVLFFIVPDFMADRLALIFHGSGDQLIFQQPAKAGVGVDFHVHLRVPSVTATGPIQVELSAPESFGIRTDYKCPASGLGGSAGPV